MAMFTDTVTIYNKISDTEWSKTVVEGVQWTDKMERKNENGRLSVIRYVLVTFPEGTYDGILLDASRQEDCIVYGKVEDIVNDIAGSRLTDLMKKYPKSGLVKSVNDNSNRNFLKNIKVVVY